MLDTLRQLDHPEAIIHRLHNGWVIEYESDADPGYYLAKVVQGDDAALIDCLMDVLCLDFPRRDEDD